MDKKGQQQSPAQSLIDFQATTKYFFEAAGQCFDLCQKDFTSKTLTPQEKQCNQSCFAKQLRVYSSLSTSISETAWWVDCKES